MGRCSCHTLGATFYDYYLVRTKSLPSLVLFLRDARSIIEGSSAKEDEEEGEDWS